LSKLDIRQFEYTRQQWTGKSPKQFLIDWCRKHKVDTPKYHRMNPIRNFWKCRYGDERAVDDSKLSNICVYALTR